MLYRCVAFLGVVWMVLAFSGYAEAEQLGKFALPTHNQASADVFGKTLPPVGYVKFCGRGQEECRFANGTKEKLNITTEKWNMIVQVNTYVQTKIRPVSDMELYGVADYWTYPTNAGDCEDFALLKKRYLVSMGFNPDVLLITVVLDEAGEGHAVLTVVTDKGDYILDNRRNEIIRWDGTGYTFLKRQSQYSATAWESLQPARQPMLVSTKSN